MAKRKAAVTAEWLAQQAPQGWTAVHGTGTAFDWDQAEDDAWERSQARKADEGRTWVRFSRTDGDLHVVIALNVSTPGSGKFHAHERERAWRGRVVEGHTMYNGRSFTRRGIDCSSNRLTDRKEDQQYAHTYGDLAALLAGEYERCRAAHERSKTMVDVPGLPGQWRITPDRKAAIALSLKGGGTAQFTPHGMGVGYAVFGRNRKRAFSKRLPAETAAFFGVADPLYYETIDCD